MHRSTLKLMCIILISGFVHLLKAEKSYFSDDKSTYVQWVCENGETILKSYVRGVEFKSRLGITLDNINYNFDKISGSKKIKVTGQEYVLYQFLSKKSPISVEVAILNNAVAFRYTSNIGKGLTMKSEASSFKIPENANVYYFERKNTWKLKSYAGTWEKCLLKDLPTISGSNSIQGKPLIFELQNGKYALATEANLQNYSGLRWDCATPNWIKADFTEASDGFYLSAALCTPWRVIFVAENLTELVNQEVIKQLSPKPDALFYANTDYIIPGKSVWRWFSRGTGTPEQEREFIDYASELKFRYSVIDEGYVKWESYWKKLKELADYGNTKGVKLFLWNHSNTISDPADDYVSMRKWLDKVKRAGMAGIKVDFMNSESKFFIDFELKLLKECAIRKLMLNFHGCQSPSGESYTYPNEITREGIRGLELNKMSEGPIPSYHNVLLPFTRLAVGHGDYTPLSFVNPGNTTFAHQLATLVAFNSPLQVVAEDPEVLLHNSLITPALDFIKAVPTVWDKTIVLPQTELGKTAVVVRKSGNEWFIYALNGTDLQRTITINIANFVPDNSQFETTIYADDLSAEKVKIEGFDHRPTPLQQQPVIPFKKEISKTKQNEILVLAPNGGAVLWIKQIKN
jgi:alpha-glucosidase